jgi:hypothetical protein
MTRSAKRAAAKKPSIALRKTKFLKLLHQTANVSRSARGAGLSSSTAYLHRNRYPKFRADWKAALTEALDDLENILFDRVRNGVDKLIWFGGELKGTMQVYSDALAMFMLEAKRPEIYDRSAQKVIMGEFIDVDAMAEVDRRLARLAGPGRG